MPYVKTVWNEGGAPGISAANMNHLETQYDQAKADLDAHVADADPHSQYAKDSELNTHKGATPLDHPDGSVTTDKLANEAVTAAKVAADVAKKADVGNGVWQPGITPRTVHVFSSSWHLLAVDGIHYADGAPHTYNVAYAALKQRRRYMRLLLHTANGNGSQNSSSRITVTVTPAGGAATTVYDATVTTPITSVLTTAIDIDFTTIALPVSGEFTLSITFTFGSGAWTSYDYVVGASYWHD